MRDDALDLIGGVSEFLQRGLEGLIDNLQHAAAGEQLIFYERNVRFDPGGIAIHQEADRARWREHGYLCVAITVAVSYVSRCVPSLCGFLFQMGELFCVRDLVHRTSIQ